MTDIEWKVTEQNVTQELVSKDNRWHIRKKQEGDEPPEFFLSNYDLLLTPHGSGGNYRECFEAFIADCDAYVNKVRKIRGEAQDNLQKMINSENGVIHEN